MSAADLGRVASSRESIPPSTTVTADEDLLGRVYAVDVKAPFFLARVIASRMRNSRSNPS
ncbi:hypothetical protein [Nocardia sp. NPDC005745]|uniref:hypothetical protein n=1 Tax=Nocardia sp. NPDC005745 TaxID=3157061 RepID=UPI0033E2E2B5